ncbi:EF-P lysine aminoacylase GenX [Candidatus Uhrbacteria bacterium]|nr:EF-P lysine aminoacylase GenX [Candidatus Uhrbacteria bacterium]
MRDIGKIIRERQEINDGIRAFFRSRAYLEVETPILVESPGMESNLDPFETVVEVPGGGTFGGRLITSPEYSMKKILGEGIERIFTLTKVFRNQETFGGMHNPEFTMLEWYQAGAEYQACMNETQALLFHLGFKGEIERCRVRDVFLKEAEVDLDFADHAMLKTACKRFDIHTDASDTVSDLFFRLFLDKVEPTFQGRNLFLYDYPVYQASLSQLTHDGLYGQRFELYLNGMELCNGFTELTNALEQRERFQEEARERKLFGKPVYPIDEELLRLLPSLRNPTFGNALGVDRLHMALKGYKQIQDVLLFPAKNLFTH